MQLDLTSPEAVRGPSPPKQTGTVPTPVPVRRPPGADGPAMDPKTVAGLQATVGNTAVRRVLDEKSGSSAISAANREQMQGDVEFIVAGLRQQVLFAGNEQELVDRVAAWAAWDESYRSSGGRGSPFLDTFLGLLKARAFPRSTARMGFGLAGQEYLSAFDGLFYELEDERLEQLKALVAKSAKQATSGPETAQMESVGGYVGKRVGLGFLGIIKQTSLAVASIADALAWADWRAKGLPGDPPNLSKEVASGFDYLAHALADNAKEGATPEELKRYRQELVDEYDFGDRWGTIVGILMSAGMGGGRAAVKAVSYVGQFAQGAAGDRDGRPQGGQAHPGDAESQPQSDVGRLPRRRRGAARDGQRSGRAHRHRRWRGR